MTKTKERAIAIGIAVLAVIACVAVVYAFSHKSTLKITAGEQEPSVKALQPLPDGKYYAYGDTSRPYYELSGDKIQLQGISFETYEKLVVPSENYVNNLDAGAKEKYLKWIEDDYLKNVNPRYYTLAESNYLGKYIELGHKPGDTEPFSGEILAVTDDGLILGFNPITFSEKSSQAANGGVEYVPYVLVENPELRKSSQQTFPNEYDVLTPASATGHTVWKVAKPNDSFRFEGSVAETFAPTTGETDFANPAVAPDRNLSQKLS